MARATDGTLSDPVLNSDQQFSRDMEDAMDAEFADIDAQIVKHVDTKSDLVLLQRPHGIAIGDRAAHQLGRKPGAVRHPSQHPLANMVSASALRARFRRKTKQVKHQKPPSKTSTPALIPASHKPSQKNSGRQQAWTTMGKSSQARSSSNLRPSLRIWKSAYHVLRKQLAETQAFVRRLESRLRSSHRRAKKAERVNRRLASALTAALGGSSDGPEVDVSHAHGLNGFGEVGAGGFERRQSA